MEADKACVGPGRNLNTFQTDSKLIEFGVKGQNVRLWDIFAIGPLMLYGGVRLTKENPILGPILAILGVTTVYYNARNYLRVKESKLFYEFSPSLYDIRGVTFERPNRPWRCSNRPKLNLVVPKYSYLNEVGLSNRSCLSNQLGFRFGPLRFKIENGKKKGNCPRPELRRPFTMKNTLIPLDIAFLDRKMQIIQLRRMPEPGSQALVTPPKGTVYAIEANAGWFKVNDVREGDVANMIGKCPGDDFNFGYRKDNRGYVILGPNDCEPGSETSLPICCPPKTR